MKLPPRILVSLVALIAVLAVLGACGDGDNDHECSGLADGLHGTTLCKRGSGHGTVGIFAVTGPFDVRVVGGNIGSDNTIIQVFEIEQVGSGSSTTLVGTTGPKALVTGIQVRPGEAVDVNFDFGDGEYFLSIETDGSNDWTTIVSPVAGLPAG